MMKQTQKKNKQTPSFNEEQLLWQQGMTYVAGIDEVGRGCFAGPVVAAAVIFSPCKSPCTHTLRCDRCAQKEVSEINDSKVLTAKKRTELAQFIKKNAAAYTIAEVSVGEINAVGIGKAVQKAFHQAVISLMPASHFLLIDAFYIETIDKSIQKPIIKGDSKSISIAAASIIAKVYRDALMEQLPAQYVQYEFAVNKGYGTKKHRDAIAQYGLSDLHRTSFRLEKFLKKR